MIGSLIVECIVYDTNSLKEKRAVIKRIIERIKNRFNVSVCESGFQNLWQRTEISFAVVSTDKIQAEKELSRILQFIDSYPEIEVTHSSYEWY